MGLNMAVQLRYTLLAVVILFSPFAMAQAGDNLDPNDTTQPSTTSEISSPRTSDAYTTQSSDSKNDNSQYPIVHYYFVFFALVLCVAVGAAFWMYRRKQRHNLFMQQSRENALEQDLNTWDAGRARRRYWQGRWRSADVGREEGLNENGEAPPPYMPKTRDGEAGTHNGVNEPAVPMQALSREQAGLKPPDYAEVHATETHPSMNGATGSQGYVWR